MMGLRMLLRPGQELVFAGDPDDKGMRSMTGSANSVYLPYTIMMMNPVRKGKPAECKNLSSLRDKVPVAGRTTAYLCQNGSCQKPMNDVDELMDLLRSDKR
jgi:uncharacterized protein YyaL (SSP411 family)